MQIAIFIPTLLVCGCGKSGTTSQSPAGTGKVDRLCAAIKETGIDNQCATSERDNAVDIVIDTIDDEQARRTCADIAVRMTPRAAEFPAHMKLRMYSPVRRDKAIATCSLNAADNSGLY